MSEFLVIGHRGAAGEVFENSLSGFRYALSLGIDAIEFDIRAHKGELWVMHDHDLGRLTGQAGLFDALKDPTSVKLLNNEPMPRLREVLDLLWGKIPLNIEIKSFNTGSLLLDLLNQYPAIEQDSEFPSVLISSFDHQQILDLRRKSCPWALAPITTGIPINVDQLMDELQPYSWNMDDEYLDADFIKPIQERGIPIFVYTVNSVERARFLKKAGIRGIFTDCPSSMLSTR